jgi:hypothetical protein
MRFANWLPDWGRMTRWSSRLSTGGDTPRPAFSRIESNLLSSSSGSSQMTKGGSAFLLAGAIFWLAASMGSIVLAPGAAINFYVFGGFSVPRHGIHHCEASG